MVTICALEVPFTSVDHCLMVVDFSNPVGLVVANAALVEEDIEVSAQSVRSKKCIVVCLVQTELTRLDVHDVGCSSWGYWGHRFCLTVIFYAKKWLVLQFSI